jgi:hypothetical protein
MRRVVSNLNSGYDKPSHRKNSQYTEEAFKGVLDKTTKALFSVDKASFEGEANSTHERPAQY